MDNDFLKIKYNNIKPTTGKALLSEPYLLDPLFNKSVILITEHNEKGTFGLILNKKVRISLNDLFVDFPKTEMNVFLGGPVKQDTVHYLHTKGDIIKDSLKISENIYWGGDFNQVKELIISGTLTKNDIFFYLGFSGWDPGQLEEEFEENSWIVTDIKSEDVYNSSADLWKLLLNRMGEPYKRWIEFPENPVLN